MRVRTVIHNKEEVNAQMCVLCSVLQGWAEKILRKLKVGDRDGKDDEVTDCVCEIVFGSGGVDQ